MLEKCKAQINSIAGGVQMQDKSKAMPVAAPFKRKLSDNFVSMYSNVVEIRFSGTDVAIDFATVAPDLNQNLIADFKMRVFMSPQHAKQFSLLLQQGIENYEKEAGMINVVKVEQQS